MTEFKIGDRFYDCYNGQCFVLKSYDEGFSGWRVHWGDIGASGLIYNRELNTLNLLGAELIQIKDDKHLLELKLRYG